MANIFLLQANGERIELAQGGGFILLAGISDEGHGGGGAVKGLKRFKRIDIIPYMIEGELLLVENLQMSGLLLRNEIKEVSGFLKQKQVTEAIGKLSITEQFKLNAKLRTMIRKQIVESRDPISEEKELTSMYKAIMDLLDEF